MNCDVVKDLIPLYIDGCCSDESKTAVEEHITHCTHCKKNLDDMKTAFAAITAPKTPKTYSKINEWKASILQSVLLFVSFALITIGVALESRTTSEYFTNGLFAFNFVVPATGFMLSLANWYFVRVYKSRKSFSNASWVVTLVLTLSAYLWSDLHYNNYNIGRSTFSLLIQTIIKYFSDFFDFLHSLVLWNGFGLLLTVIFCILSKVLSDKYAALLGKE